MPTLWSLSMDPYWYDTINLDNIHMKYHELIMVGNLTLYGPNSFFRRFSGHNLR